MAKFALLQRQFLPKMYESVSYLQNYPRTDQKRRTKNPIHIFFLQIDVERLYGDNLIRHLETF